MRPPSEVFLSFSKDDKTTACEAFSSCSFTASRAFTRYDAFEKFREGDIGEDVPLRPQI